jgi:hypothetical protein
LPGRKTRQALVLRPAELVHPAAQETKQVANSTAQNEAYEQTLVRHPIINPDIAGFRARAKEAEQALGISIHALTDTR